jgi:hypothetical protein
MHVTLYCVIYIHLLLQRYVANVLGLIRLKFSIEESKCIIEHAQRYIATYEQKMMVIMENTCKF